LFDDGKASWESVCYCTGVVSSSDPVEAVDNIDSQGEAHHTYSNCARREKERDGEISKIGFRIVRAEGEGPRSRKRPTTRKDRYQDEEDEEEEERREWRQFEQQRRSNFLSLDMKKIMSE
jgi:hypothetical protein